MSEVKSLIGLKWELKLPCLALNSKTGSSSSKVAERLKSGSLWTSKSELVDGLCLPPTDPKKVNKMIRKQLKDTTGSNWFDMPAPTMTPELKRELQMLKVIDNVQEEKSRTDRKPPGVGRGRIKHGGAAENHQVFFFYS